MRFRWHNRSAFPTVRSKILRTFVALAAITLCFGFAAIHGVDVTTVALLIGALIVTMRAGDRVASFAAASQAAGGIVVGDLDVRGFMQREVTSRRVGQGALGNAIEGLNEGVALVAADGRVLLANPQLGRFFPAQAKALADGAALPAKIAAALAGPTGEIRIADGRWLRLSRSKRPEGGFVLIATDITLLKEREAQLYAAKEQAEAADQAKTQFVTNMSHELRTPLSAIIGFSELIATESLGPVAPPKYREFADDILHSGRHLLDLINDILDVAKLQSGKMELQMQPVASRSIIDGAVRIVRHKAEQAGIKLSVDVPAKLPVIHADHVRLRQVLLNLLSNAIKFTPAGGDVAIIAEPCGGGLVITVRDTGVGMAPEDIPRALQSFVQVDSSLSRRHGGTGLGLPLSKQFVDLHGGQFEIQSEAGKGTTVRVVLPRMLQVGGGAIMA